MAKNQASDANRSGVIPDRSQASEPRVKRDANTSRSPVQKRSKGGHREILFPTEPTTIAREKIDRAIERVIARKK